MIKAWYIVKLSQIGNVGANEIKKIKEQPEDGFTSNNEAEEHLVNLEKNGSYMGLGWESWAILPLYNKNK